MMDLIDRYFAAVRRNLPAAKANDIVAELRDDFCSQEEAREAELGRSLTQEELSSLIREFGHPLVIASHYRRYQGLIGPEVFPFYLAVLRVVLLAVAGVITIVGAVAIAAANQPPLQVLAQAFGNFISSAFVSAAIVTLIFVILERTGFPAKHLAGWKPETLPALGEERPSQLESAIEVALALVLLLWWSGAVSLPLKPGGTDFRIDAAPIWAQLYWPILTLIVLRLVHNLVQWLRPRWKALRVMLSALTAIGALVLLVTIYRAGEWVTVVSTGTHATDTRPLQTSLDLSIKLTFLAVALIWTFKFTSEAWRMVRGARERLTSA
jgi:hypothetical protein